MLTDCGRDGIFAVVTRTVVEKKPFKPPQQKKKTAMEGKKPSSEGSEEVKVKPEAKVKPEPEAKRPKCGDK